jgi:hypothetical protein
MAADKCEKRGRRWRCQSFSPSRAIAFFLLIAIAGCETSPPGPTTSPSQVPPSTAAPGTPYVKPGTQGYHGAVSALTAYSAANGKIPPGSECSWASGGILRCPDDDLKLDHVNIQGSLQWTGCGTLSISNSVIEWQPADKTWFSIYASCAAPLTRALISVSGSTFKTIDDVKYTGMSDVSAISEVANEVPEHISNSLFKDFPQGLDPAVDSIIEDNEIYAADGLVCWQNHAQGITGLCHSDGIFNEGSPNNTYRGNYIDVGRRSATAALFYQSDSPIAGNHVIDNYIAGGSFTLYNENAARLDVENNTFGGYVYGNCSLRSTGSWGKWAGNMKRDGTPVVPDSKGCS